MSMRSMLLALATSIAVCLVLMSTIHAAPPSRQPADPVTAVAEVPPPPACALTLSCEGSGPIVAMGDSITYGYGRGTTYTVYGPPPPGSYPWDLQGLLGIPVVNAGFPGDTAYTAMHPPNAEGHYRPPSMRIPAILALRPRLVIVGFGTAEAAYGIPLATAAANLDTLLRALGDVPTVIVGTHVDCLALHCLRPQAVPYTAPWDRTLRVLAARHGAGLVTDVERGLASAGEMTDGVHPDASGYAIVAGRVAAAVRQRLAWPDGRGWLYDSSLRPE
jgi:lysophospholipase L1-like esterase